MSPYERKPLTIAKAIVISVTGLMAMGLIAIAILTESPYEMAIYGLGIMMIGAILKNVFGLDITGLIQLAVKAAKPQEGQERTFKHSGVTYTERYSLGKWVPK